MLERGLNIVWECTRHSGIFCRCEETTGWGLRWAGPCGCGPGFVRSLYLKPHQSPEPGVMWSGRAEEGSPPLESGEPLRRCSTGTGGQWCKAALANKQLWTVLCHHDGSRYVSWFSFIHIFSQHFLLPRLFWVWDSNRQPCSWSPQQTVLGFASPPFSIVLFFLSFHVFLNLSLPQFLCFLSPLQPLSSSPFFFHSSSPLSPFAFSISFHLSRSSCVCSAYSKSCTNKQAAGGSRLLSIIQASQATARMFAKHMKCISQHRTQTERGEERNMFHHHGLDSIHRDYPSIERLKSCLWPFCFVLIENTPG